MHARPDTVPPIYQPPFIGSAPFHISCESLCGGFGVHWHGELEILYLLDGSVPLTVTVDGTDHLLLPRSAAFIAGTEVHAVQPTNGPAEVLVVEMGFSLLGGDFSVFSGRRFAQTVVPFAELFPDDPRTAIEEIALALAVHGRRSGSPADWSPLHRLQCASLLFSLAAAMAETLQLTPLSARRMRQLEAVGAVQAVLTHVEQAYPEAITLEHAAAIAGYEKTRFCQLFKQAVGVSFHKYLTDRRMRAARLLLKGTNLPIAEIARTVGIAQPKTFSRLIRAAYGTTPSELRAQRE